MRLLIVTLVALVCALGGVASAQAAGPGAPNGAAVKAPASKAKRAHHVVRRRTARPAVHRARASRAAKVKATRQAPARPAASAGMPRA